MKHCARMRLQRLQSSRIWNDTRETRGEIGKALSTDQNNMKNLKASICEHSLVAFPLTTEFHSIARLPLFPTVQSAFTPSSNLKFGISWWRKLRVPYHCIHSNQRATIVVLCTIAFHNCISRNFCMHHYLTSRTVPSFNFSNPLQKTQLKYSGSRLVVWKKLFWQDDVRTRAWICMQSTSHVSTAHQRYSSRGTGTYVSLIQVKTKYTCMYAREYLSQFI